MYYLYLFWIVPAALLFGISPGVSWRAYLVYFPLDDFEQDYMQAWKDALEQRGSVVHINIFLGDNTLCVPILFDEKNLDVGSDRDTFEALQMWYCCMQVRRGFGEIILPRKLVRISQVQLCASVDGVASLGSRVKTFELGRNGSTQVANFDNPLRIPADQRFQTASMLEDPTAQGVATYGLEFVRAWDSTAISIIALMPFLLSLLFVALWIGICVGKYDVDVQVATQTAFTVAAFIVTAGKTRSTA
ncbi:hypothetical protein LTR85_005594 [Meristemomyces frigidus]|nr:hypothetical protein LTR85_005594 [Meristemomyces frigidus]